MTDLGESKTKRILRVLAVGIVLLIGGCGQEEKKPEIKSLFVPVDREQIKAIEVAEKKAVELKVKLEEKDLMIKKDGADYTVMFWPKPNS
jgi:hypothetical protein